MPDGPSPSCGRCGRNDSRVIAIVIAAARTTRPASWPPIRRMFRGSVAETEVALIRCEFLWTAAGLVAAGLAVACGETVGNRLEVSFPVLVSGLGSAGAGNVGSGGSGLVLGGGVVVAGAGFRRGMILTEPDALKEAASFAFAFAMSVTWWPIVASFRTATLTCSSSAWPCGRFPSAQVAPLASGQTENCGAAVPWVCWTVALTVTFLVLPWVLQTQTV